MTETDSACSELGLPYSVPNSSFSWSSDNQTAVTVDGSGNVTYQGSGTANITASAVFDIFHCVGFQTEDGCNCPLVDPLPIESAQKPVTSLVPTSVSVVTGVLAGSATQCSSSEYGAEAEITYQVKDQNGNPLKASGMQPQEIIINFIINDLPQPDPAPNWANLGQSTDSNGRFKDTPLGTCYPFATTQTATQKISVLFHGNRYPASGALKTNSLRFTGPTAGHGRVCNGSGSNCTGADFDVSR